MTPADAPPPQLAARRSTRVLLRLLAVVSLALAVLGAILPGLPCTEFVLLAAWAAARSSPRLHHWLIHHPRLGPPLRNWNDGKRVSRRSKWTATASMSVCAVILCWEPHWWVRGLAWGGMAIGLWVLWNRPEPREPRPPAT